MQRQIQGEGAALPGRADQFDFAAEQRRKFAADGQAQAGAAVFAAGAGVGLLKRLENEFLLFRRDSDAGVGHRNGDGCPRGSQHRMVRRPSLGHLAHRHGDVSLCR